VDVHGNDDERVLQFIYLNSYFEAGIKSPLDDAILKHEHPTIAEYAKADEIPFDFSRKRLSVVVQHDDEHLLITKGEAEGVFAVCKTVSIDGTVQPFDEGRRSEAEETYRKLSADGYRTLGVAVRNVEKQDAYSVADEQDMTLVGFAAFLDPPKEGVLSVLESLKRNAISVVIMTGDNQYVTQKVARDVGLAADRVLTGNQIDGMDDAALAYHAEDGAIFARVSPEQKNRVILALKSRGHVVGFIGDGINDAPSLHTADVGISVMNGVEVEGQGSLLQEHFAAFQDAPRRIEGFFGRLHFGLRLGEFLRQSSGNGAVIIGLRLVQLTLGVNHSRREIAIFQNSQQLPFADVRTPVHKELVDRSTDLGSDARLVECVQNPFRLDHSLDGSTLDLCGLHGGNRFSLLGLFMRATRGQR
jgi:Mg2+-importing ATPase